MRKIITSLFINALALYAATQVVPGIAYFGDWTGLAVVALVFGLVNAIIRPLVKMLAFPLTLVTLGLFTIVINAAMLWLTSVISQRIGYPLVVNDPLAAILGALVISVVSLVVSILVPEKE